MKREDGKRYDDEGNELAYWKGKAEGLQEALGKVKDKGGSIWKEKIVEHSVRSGFVVLGFLVVGAIAYFQVIKPFKESIDNGVEKVERSIDSANNSISSVKKSVTDKYDSAKKSVKDFGHDINPVNWEIFHESNETELNELENSETSDENKTSWISSIFSSDEKESENNVSVSEEKVVDVEIIKSTEKIEIEVTKIEDNRTITQKVKGKWSSWFSKKKENNESKE